MSHRGQRPQKGTLPALGMGGHRDALHTKEQRKLNPQVLGMGRKSRQGEVGGRRRIRGPSVAWDHSAGTQGQGPTLQEAT